MNDFFKDLWKDNKILFLLLLPLITLYFLRDIIINLLISSSRKISKEARKRDDELRAEQDSANAAADAKRKQAEEREKQIENLEDDESWHKRRK